MGEPVCVEEWRDIVGYEGLYQVSNTGKIKRTARTYPRSYHGKYPANLWQVLHHEKRKHAGRDPQTGELLSWEYKEGIV